MFARALPREPPGVGGRACHAQRVIELRPVCRIRRHRRQVQFGAAALFIAMWWNRVWRVVDRWPHAHARAPASGSAASCSAGQPACDDRASVHGRQSCSGPNTPLRPPRPPRVWRHAVLNMASAAYNMQENDQCMGSLQRADARVQWARRNSRRGRLHVERLAVVLRLRGQAAGTRSGGRASGPAATRRA